MAVATQEVFAHTDALVEIWDAGAATPANTLLVKGGRAGVTLTNTAGIATKRTKAVGPYDLSAPAFPGVGNDLATAVGTRATGVAVDGTWEFEGVAGATLATAQTADVYVTGAGALTLTAGTNTKVGVVNYPATYVKVAGTLPVKIGA
ncbi:hypothetical protein [Microbacterium sp.]|uniref:hypothetical protein n=1 Tax=Microbacterium sp. TaxID=51671 RepID=UPI0039E22843